jgi:hypothetical protein
VLDGRGISGRDPLSAGTEGVVTVVTTRSLPDRYEPLIQRVVQSGSFDFYDDPSRGYEVVYPLSEVAETRLRDFSGGHWFFGFTSNYEVLMEVDGNAVATTGPTLIIRRLDLDDATLVALGILRPQILAIEGASTIERNYDEIYAYGADVMYLRYLVPDGIPDRVRMSSNFSEFEDYSVFDWRTGSFVEFDEEQEFDLSGRISPSGEVMIRASVPEGSDPFEDFYNEPIRTSRYALRWSEAS